MRKKFQWIGAFIIIGITVATVQILLLRTWIKEAVPIKKSEGFAVPKEYKKVNVPRAYSEDFAIPRDNELEVKTDHWHELARLDEKKLAITSEHWEGFTILGDNICERTSNEDLFVMTIIISTSDNFERRKAIRETWGKDASKNDNRGRCRMAFLLAQSRNDSINMLAIEESVTFKDIIQINIFEDYKNLTRKSLALMRWVNDQCTHAQYVFKTDDDMYINFPNLIRATEEIPVKKDVIFGFLLEKCKRYRDPKSRWYVSDSVYPNDTYPDFVSGTAYVMPTDVASRIYHNCNSKIEMEFPLEDVFITGICGQKLGLERLHVKGFNCESFPSTGCGLKNVISSHRVKPLAMRRIWKELQDPLLKC